jgi:hypothetical protein
VALVTAAAVITAVSVKVDLLRGGSPAACPSSSQPGFQQVTRLKGAAGTDLIVCPVQVDHGQNSGLNLSLSGTILGGPPGGQLLMVAFQPDPNSCATDGTKGSGGYYLAGRLHLTASGGWRVTSPDHYSAARSIQWHIYLLLGSQAALHSFAQAQDAYGEAHDGDVGQWGGKPTLDGFRQLARFTITPVRPINRYCSR